VLVTDYSKRGGQSHFTRICDAAREAKDRAGQHQETFRSACLKREQSSARERVNVVQGGMAVVSKQGILETVKGTCPRRHKKDCSRGVF